jgi:hypothetical protein
MKNESNIVINRPIKDVFRLTNEHVAEWSIIVVEDEVIEETPDGVGTTFRCVTEENGQRMEFQGVVTKYDPPFMNATVLTGKMFDLDIEYTFEEVPEGTRVIQVSKVTGKGLAKIMFFFMALYANIRGCKSKNDEFESLKLFCESQPEPDTE